MKTVLGLAAAALLLCGVGGVASAEKKTKKTSSAAATRPATPKQQNQFVTVEEFLNGKLPAGTAVSVEGYGALGFRTGDGGIRIYIVDSVDHILSAADANAAAATAAVSVIPVSVLRAHPAWGWNPKGSMRIPMFTGSGAAQKQLRDVAPRVRVTGWTASARATISPVTKLEITNDNGEWVPLR